jgi:hypothetical protein
MQDYKKHDERNALRRTLRRTTMKPFHRLLTLLLLLGAASFSTMAIAQITSARLTGAITDATGALVPQVRITVHNVATNLTQKADSSANGTYAFNALPPGQYTLTTAKDGFATHIEKNVTLTVGQSATLDITLKTGGAEDTVTVTGGAELINTTTAEISQVIGQAEVEELPLNGRDPSSLVYLSAGVTNETISQAASTQTNQSFSTQTGASAGGGRQGSTWYLLDGVANMDTTTLLAAPFPNADATQEFRVITNNFDARYGFAPDAVVSIQTKSGTNEVHGGLFEFVRNYDADGKYWFSGQSDNLKRNQFGAFAGAPVIKDKLFVFGNYQGTRTSSISNQVTANTPTAAMLAGDFSGVVDQNGNSVALHGYDPTQPNPFQTINGKPNQIDPKLFSAGALALDKSIPVGQDPNSGLVRYAQPAQKTNYDEGTGRIDYTINNQQRVFARLFIDNLNQPGQNIPGNILSGVEGQHGVDLNAAINHSWTVTPTLVNSLTAAYISYDLDSGTQVKDASGKPICLSQFINVADPAGQCYINLGVSNGNALYGGASGFSVFSGQPYQTNRRLWLLSDTATKIIGKNTLAAGFDTLHRRYYENYGGQVNPAFGFNGTYTGFIQSDFLLGYSTGVSQGTGEVGATSGWMFGAYVQDQYKLRPNITLNVGVRWDPNLTPTIDGDRGAAFIPGKQSTRFPNAPLGMVFAGEQGIPSGLVKNSYSYFQPRVGVAWQINEKTALRAGMGFFTTPLEDAFYNRVWDVNPFDPSYGVPYNSALPDPFDNPWSQYAATGGKSPFPPFVTPNTAAPSNSAFPIPEGMGAVFDPNFKLGITQSWNLSVERQIGQDLALHVAYVGSESYHQATTVEQNPGHYYGAGDPRNGTRPAYANFVGILQVQDGGTASYHSMQAGIEKRLSHAFQVQSNFTWSKAMDVGGSGDPTFESSVSDPLNIRHDHGPSSLNYPFIWVSNLIYHAPQLSKQNVLIRSALGGWEISGLYSAQSGPAFTMNGGNGNNNSFFNVGQDRADVVPGQSYKIRSGSKSQWLNQYFNVNAFTQNAPGTPGSIEKYAFQEAPVQDMDLAVIKNFSYQDRYKMQIRFESFNALNHPSFGQPDSNPGDSNFGQITNSGPTNPRVMQGGVKVTF